MKKFSPEKARREFTATQKAEGTGTIKRAEMKTVGLVFNPAGEPC